MKIIVKTLPLLLFTPLAFAAGPRAKTLECQVSYSWLKNDRELNHDKLPKIAVKLKRDIDAPRLTAEAKQLTSDGRYEVNVWGLQPLPGDDTRFEQLNVQITDRRTGTLFFPHGATVQSFQHQTHADVTVMPESEDDKPAHGITVICDLK